jgi:hypothetical protein
MYDAVIFTDTNQTHGVFKSIGPSKISYVLRQHGFTCLIIDLATHFTIDELLTIILRCVSSRTLFVGISSTFILRLPGPLRLLQLTPDEENRFVQGIRAVNKSCKIVLGGSQATPNTTHKHIDYSILGYAEASILSLAYHLRDGTALKYSHKNINGVIVIDDRFGKDYPFTDSNFSWDSFDVANYTVLPIEIARGCIFNCRFCSYPLNGKKQLDFLKPEEAIYSELLDNYERFGITNYSFIDDTFNDSDFKLDMMLRVVKRLPFRPRFWAYLRLDLITTRPDSIAKLYDIGLQSTYFGIETLNRKTGMIIGKGYDRTKQIKMIEQIRTAYGNDIIMHGSFIVGLPHESVKSVNSTADALFDGSIPLHSYIFSGLHISKPGPTILSDISKNYAKYGYEELIESDTSVFKWKNEHMTIDEAYAMADDFNRRGHASDRFHVSGQSATGLRNLGCSEDYVRETKFNQIDWPDMDQRKITFVEKYKELLDKKLNDPRM